MREKKKGKEKEVRVFLSGSTRGKKGKGKGMRLPRAFSGMGEEKGGKRRGEKGKMPLV